MGGASEEVPVDERLFLEEVDDTDDDDDSTSGGGGAKEPGHTQEGVMSPGDGGQEEEEEEVTVDESLFDVDNLQDLNLDDPSILDLPQEQT